MLGLFADLEWLGDLAWNIGCIMVSEQNFELSNIFEEIPITINPGIPGNTEWTSDPDKKITNQGGLSILSESYPKMYIIIISQRCNISPNLFFR